MSNPAVDSDSRRSRRARRARHRERGNYGTIVLMALLREGPLTPEALEVKTGMLATQARAVAVRAQERAERATGTASRPRNPPDQLDTLADSHIESEFEKLIAQGKVVLNGSGKYELTELGRQEAVEYSARMENAAGVVQRKFLDPSAAAKNAIVLYFLLSVLKLICAFISGSVALLADGTDSTIDTASAVVVWAGMKYKKELVGTVVIILLMLGTALSLGYEAVMTTTEALAGRAVAMTSPLLVIGVECVSAVLLLALSYYLRFVGRRSGSLSLVSQSVDATNSVYVAAAVIVGAIFSMVGVNLVDALVGGLVAIRIFIDGVGLARETYKTVRGGKADLTKYPLPFEKKWQEGRAEAFRAWALYSVAKGKATDRDGVASFLETTLADSYVPFLSELGEGIAKGYDFRGGIDDVLKPLLDEGLLVEKEGKLYPTEKGNARLTRLFKPTRYRQRV